MGLFRDLGKKVEEFKQNVERERSAEIEAVCTACGEQFFTPQEICSECGSNDIVSIGEDSD